MNAEKMEDQKRIEKEFESLGLDEKFSSLFRMEVATISEAVKYVAKEPMKVAEKIGEIIVEFGHRVETEIKNAVSNSGPATSAAEEKKSKKHRTPKNSNTDPSSN